MIRCVALQAPARPLPRRPVPGTVRLTCHGDQPADARTRRRRRCDKAESTLRVLSWPPSLAKCATPNSRRRRRGQCRSAQRGRETTADGVDQRAEVVAVRDLVPLLRGQRDAVVPGGAVLVPTRTVAAHREPSCRIVGGSAAQLLDHWHLVGERTGPESESTPRMRQQERAHAPASSALALVAGQERPDARHRRSWTGSIPSEVMVGSLIPRGRHPRPRPSTTSQHDLVASRIGMQPGYDGA
jgi:hypothetical protein